MTENKQCELVDHDIHWAGDGYFCSKCMTMFVSGSLPHHQEKQEDKVGVCYIKDGVTFCWCEGLEKDESCRKFPQPLVESWEREFDEMISETVKNLGDIPEPTCPQIDKVLEGFSDLERICKKADRNYDSVAELAEDIEWAIPSADLLEKLRTENAQLRDLGKGWYEEARNLKSFIRLTRKEAREEGEREVLEWVAGKLERVGKYDGVVLMDVNTRLDALTQKNE